MQNTSHAVMAQRVEAADSLDNFPTPPWATRALLEHILNDRGPFKDQSCLEPACGPGHMAKPLAEYFGEVRASDIYPYEYGAVSDFLTAPHEAGAVDWVITNPPFRLAENFIKRSLIVARKGVAILARQSSSRASAAIARSSNSIRQRKRAHIAMLRHRAIARLKRDGRIGGNIKIDGLLYRAWDLNKWPWTIELIEPRYPRDFDYLDLSSTLTVRFKGERVLKIAFDDERSKLVVLIPGPWEDLV